MKHTDYLQKAVQCSNERNSWTIEAGIMPDIYNSKAFSAQDSFQVCLPLAGSYVETQSRQATALLVKAVWLKNKMILCLI